MTHEPQDVRALADEELVRRSLAGDKSAYGTIVERHQRRMVGYLQRMLRDREAALDVAQETFIKAWQALARYDPSWRFSTWLYSIASNAAIDHMRARRRKLVSLDEPIQTEDSEVSRELPSPDDGPDLLAEGEEMREVLEKAIAKLPEEYRMLILLRHPVGKSYEEIAEMTRLPMGTVKNRIFRARQQLKEMLGDILPADI